MKKGFTLIELLIVIGVLAILSVAVVLTLNPAELLRQARDSTRLSDLATIKSALALYLVDAVTPAMGTVTECSVYRKTSETWGGGVVAGCDANGGTAVDGYAPRFTAGTPRIVTSVAIDTNGWIPVNLATLPNGAPISAYPADPLQNVTTDFFYAYRNGGTGGLEYEVNANLESNKYTPMEVSDGGNANATPSYYEIGTDPGLDL